MNKPLKEILELFDELLSISDEIGMNALSVEDKELILHSGILWRNSIDEFRIQFPDQFTRTAVKLMINDFLVFWNESIGLETEKFWAEVERRNLKIERKRSLRNVLKRGRFLHIHEVISARRQWEMLINSVYIQKQFNKYEVAQLVQIMQEDETKRVNLFRKCLRNNRLSDSDAMRYCDNTAYFSKYRLYDSHFSPKEMEDIYRIRQESEDRWERIHKKQCNL